MYLKSKGKNIILHEQTLSGLGWPAILSVPQGPPAPAPSDPFAALAAQAKPASIPPPSWGALAVQAGNNPFAAVQPRPAAPPSSGGGFFGNLIQGGMDMLKKFGSGGTPAAPAQPTYIAPAQSSGMGIMPIALIGAAGVAAFLILRKKG